MQKNHLNWYIVEQLPVVPPEVYEATKFGAKTAKQIILDAVIELTYTSEDMRHFAEAIGFVDNDGKAKKPFLWNEDRRMKLMAKLNAIFFYLYQITNRDDVRYVYSTFSIVDRGETAAYGRYRSRDLCLAYLNALAAGDPDAEVNL